MRAVTAAIIATAVAIGAQVRAGPALTPQSNQDSASQPTPQGPTFRSGVYFVNVDVLVTDKNGTAVNDLKPEDFEVIEASKTQTIETFKLVSLDGGLLAAAPPRDIRTDEDEQREASSNDVRLFAIFMDDYHVKRASILRMREQLARFVETQLGPSDMIGLMHPLDPIAAVRMTRNHHAVRRAILQFEGRKHDYSPKTDGEAQCVLPLLANLQVVAIEQMRNRISFGALRALIMQMGALKEGRKSIILLSEGYTNTLPREMQEYAGGLGMGKVAANVRVPAGCGATVDSDLQLRIDLQEIYNLANRNNVAIYAVDPRGLAVSEYGMDLPDINRTTDRQYLSNTMDTLKTLAEDSGGRWIVNRNDVTIAMKQIVVDSSAFYLLGYRSSTVTPDGKFHPITVKVKRPGLEIRHRPGYWAIKPDEAARLAAPAPASAPNPVEAALAAYALRNRTIRTWIGTSRGTKGQTRVTFVWEPAVQPAGIRGSDARPVRIALTASAADGSQYFRGRVPDAGDATAIGAMVSFEAPPGTIQLRLSIEGAQGDILDSEVREIGVPDLTLPRTLLGTPEVFRARTPAELQRLKTLQNPVPSASREFSRNERLLLRVPVYARSGMAAVGAQLLNRAGQIMSELPATPDDTRTEWRFELSLASLSPGEYGVQFSVTGQPEVAREIVAFRVMP